jgi:hypothetical protein
MGARFRSLAGTLGGNKRWQRLSIAFIPFIVFSFPLPQPFLLFTFHLHVLFIQSISTPSTFIFSHSPVVFPSLAHICALIHPRHGVPDPLAFLIEKETPTSYPLSSEAARRIAWSRQ